ncbi:class I SAM-dependent methyltransferase [Mangrovihabitans endophyticus]|nr:50S ribosomal protein L11 methyltransferase [Mangrovihabitans endophyticus]
MPVPLTPEISLHLAGERVGLFDAAGGEFRSSEPPPFWAFVWAGGQALARYLLDHPAAVAGREVLDIACGSGVVAIAAARAGASRVHAIDIDPGAVHATERNAAANGVAVEARVADAREIPELGEVVLAGDVFYSPTVARQMTTGLRKCAARGASTLIGDPGRGYLPERLCRRVAEYEVAVPAALEEAETLITGVWTMLSPTNKL